MAEETGRLLNETIEAAVQAKAGYGHTLGMGIGELDLPHKESSLFWNMHRLGIAATIHCAIGTDIIHQHPAADGAALGETSFTDFRIFVSEVSNLGHGGVLMNFGSAVVMPEVFLKALSIARNLGNDVVEFTTANFDVTQHYRPRENILKRPTNMGGKSYAITGHHEIMIPLLAHAVMDRIARVSGS